LTGDAVNEKPPPRVWEFMVSIRPNRVTILPD
jgi:hypothetical protein